MAPATVRRLQPVAAPRPLRTGPLRIADTPAVALRAYQRGATTLAVVDRSCHLSWTLLAAVGELESDHGRRGGAVLRPGGVSRPLVRGMPLDGTGAAPRLADSDGGELDGDHRWDRAVGPMQILPSVWSHVAVDGDGDGERSPDDLDDAALAAAVFFCGAADDLSARGQLRSAVRAYNSVAGYARTVLRLQARYRHGASGEPVTAAASGPASSLAVAATAPLPSRSVPGRPSREGRTPEAPATSMGATLDPVEESDRPLPTSPAPVPPTQEPALDPDTHPAPDAPADREPEPTQEPEPDPAPEPPVETPLPDAVALRGLLQQCEGGSGWCVAGMPLDLGGDDWSSAPAVADFDGDGAVETKEAELSGLAGQEVEVLVVAASTPAAVRSISGLEW